eukprot:gene8256-11172_t
MFATKLLCGLVVNLSTLKIASSFTIIGSLTTILKGTLHQIQEYRRFNSNCFAVVKKEMKVIPSTPKIKSPKSEVSSTPKKSTKVKLSEEQKEIIQLIKDGNNVIVDAVAGSGKTTTILGIGQELGTKIREERKKILVCTYNKKLKFETRQKVIAGDLKDIFIVDSFHSCGVRFYGPDCHTDTGLENVIKRSMSARNVSIDVKNICMVIIDEAQDLTPILFNFIIHFIYDIVSRGSKLQIVVLGDTYQAIYQFLKADVRFMKYFGNIDISTRVLKDSNWKLSYLSYSYRLTYNMARFVNELMLKKTRIKVLNPPGSPVTYIVGGQFLAVPWIVKEIHRLHEEEGILYSDMMILARSVKIAESMEGNERPLSVLVTALKTSKKEVLIHVSNNLFEQESEAVVKDKLCITTIHQSKGLERKVIFLFGFDNSYFKFFGLNEPQNECPNIFYVACTRAKERLYVVAEKKFGDHLPFIDRSELENLVEQNVVQFIHPDGKAGIYKYYSPISKSDESKNSSSSYKNVADKSYTVADIIQHVRIDATINDMISKLNFTCLKSKNYKISVATEQMFDDYSESVSDLTGLAVPAMLECLGGEITMKSILDKTVSSFYEQDDESSKTIKKSQATKKFITTFYSKLLKKYPNFNDPTKYHLLKVSDFLRLAAIYQANEISLIHRLKQIKEYHWFSETNAGICLEMLKEEIPDFQTANYEVLVKCRFAQDVTTRRGTEITSNKNFVKINGRIDMLGKNGLIEFKFTKILKNNDFLHLALYAWLYHVDCIEKLLKSPSYEGSDYNLFNHPNLKSLLTELNYPSNKVCNTFRLVNICTGEIWELGRNTSFLELNELARELITRKVEENVNEKTNQAFLKSNKKIIENYENKINNML